MRTRINQEGKGVLVNEPAVNLGPGRPTKLHLALRKFLQENRQAQPRGTQTENPQVQNEEKARFSLKEGFLRLQEEGRRQETQDQRQVHQEEGPNVPLANHIRKWRTLSQRFQTVQQPANLNHERL